MPTPDNKTIFPLAIFTGGDAYSTSQKIMGRQSAGKSLIKGLALNYKQSKIQTYGANKNSAITLGKQLTQDGFAGELIWQKTTNLNKIQLVNTLYYPAIPLPELAHIRNQLAPKMSIVGITHTLSSLAAMEQIGNMALPPFKPWDALICTSHAALKVVQHIQNNVKNWWSAETGASIFSNIQMPIIPLGINTTDFELKENKTQLRQHLGIDEKQCVIVFSGRLSFHGKSNPIPFYMCLEKIAQEYPNITCIEAGIYSNEHIEKAYQQAQKEYAPHIRFIHVDGKSPQYDSALHCGDIYASLSDNIQETFGITPIEAMAAGLPVIVSDWNGYKDTVRNQIDGYLIPTKMPQPGSGIDLSLKHSSEEDSYDLYIGKVSLTVSICKITLEKCLRELIGSPSLRKEMGQNGKRRALEKYDWSAVLTQYEELVQHLNTIPRNNISIQPNPFRPDPYSLFSHYPSHPINDHQLIHLGNLSDQKIITLLNQPMINFSFSQEEKTAEKFLNLLALIKNNSTSIQILKNSGIDTPAVIERMIAMLLKFDVVYLSERQK